MKRVSQSCRTSVSIFPSPDMTRAHFTVRVSLGGMWYFAINVVAAHRLIDTSVTILLSLPSREIQAFPWDGFCFEYIRYEGKDGSRRAPSSAVQVILYTITATENIPTHPRACSACTETIYIYVSVKIHYTYTGKDLCRLEQQQMICGEPRDSMTPLTILKLERKFSLWGACPSRLQAICSLLD